MGNGVVRYLEHLSNLDETRVLVWRLKDKLDTVKEQYKSKINQAEADGFQPEYIDVLRDKYAEFSNKINILEEIIDRQNVIFGNTIDMVGQLYKKSQES